MKSSKAAQCSDLMCITTHAGASEDYIWSVTLGEDVYMD